MDSLIIKYMCNLDDRETVAQISENVYMQYFLGYSSFSNETPFDASLFVSLRKRLGLDAINALNQRIVELKVTLESPVEKVVDKTDKGSQDDNSGLDTTDKKDSPHRGTVIFDATASAQNIAYPSDLNLLSDAWEVSERLIDQLYDPLLHGAKPRTYRQIARKTYLATAQKKTKGKNVIRRAVKQQLDYLKRNLSHIHRLLDAFSTLPFNKRDRKYFYVIQTLYEQQLEMYLQRKHSIADRIVSIHQPHVRPIIRGKSQAKVEFGAKLHVTWIDGISFLDELSWDPFNEGSHMEQYVEQYRERFGCYPREVLADKIYCTRANRDMLKHKDIHLRAKPLGRPSAAPIRVSPGERNAIEGKFGQAKTAYGLNCVKARLAQTSESWIAGIFLVLNLVTLAGAALPCLLIKGCLSFSATIQKKIDQIIMYYRIYSDCSVKS